MRPTLSCPAAAILTLLLATPVLAGESPKDVAYEAVKPWATGVGLMSFAAPA